MADKTETRSVLRRQVAMRRVLAALLPCLAGAIYFFGWRSLAMVAVSCAAGFITEYAFCRRRGEPVSEAVFVTAVLYALALPPTTPWHVLVIGVVFAIAFTKEAFGGFGRNIYNPALAGRAFVYVCFPVALTSAWAPAADGLWGALGQWSTTSSPDAITSATPMTLLKAGQWTPTASDVWGKLFLGRVSGSMGATSALLALIGGLYLLRTHTANRSLVVTTIVSYGALSQVLHWLGVAHVPSALPALFGSGFLFGAFFMVTDPVTSPRTGPGRTIYAVLVAVCAVVIGNFSIFNSGMMFGILLGNTFAPIIDHGVRVWAEVRRARARASAGEGGKADA